MERFAIVILALFLSFPSLAQPLDPIASDEAEKRIEAFATEPWNGSATIERRVSKFGCLYTRETLSRPGDRPIRIEVVRPEKLERAPVVVIVPTIEGITVLEPSIALQLCKKGIASIIADVNDTTVPTEFPAWGLEDRNNVAAIRALRHVLDYAQMQPHFERENIGAMGLSLGGLTVSLLAGIEPQRLRAVVNVVGGGNIPFCMATSIYELIAQIRVGRMNADGLTDIEAYETKLRSNVLHDPLHYARRIDKERVFLIMAEKDTKVPHSAQLELFEAFARPRAKIFTKGHVESLVRLTYLYMEAVEEFFSVRFGQQDEFTRPYRDVISLADPDRRTRSDRESPRSRP